MIFAICLLLAQDYEKLAPYTGVRWVEGAPEVEIDGAWCGLLEIDGTPAAGIVEFAKKTWPRLWQKRFEEDLVEVLSKMGKPPGKTVTLRVRDAKGERKLEGVAMTKENRRKIWEGARPPAAVARADAASDLEFLRSLLDEKYSYASMRGVNYGAAIEASKARLPESIGPAEFGLEVHRILALFKDGHTGVQAPPFVDGYLPFLVAEAADGVAAFLEDRSGFVDPAHPYLKSIDGVAVSKWLEAAGRINPIETRRARALQYARQMRKELGLPEQGFLKVELADAEGKTRAVEMALSASDPRYGTSPRGESRVLEGNLGYFRLESMDDRAIDLKPFEKTVGLVIDVRGNPGGTRAALRALFPYFMKAGDAPRVANVAACRVEGETLDDRWLFPAAQLTEAERESIRKLDFKPEWTPPAGQFGEWHYFVLRPGGAPFHYDRPVVVLMDGDCFSATDIFLGAFKGWRNVTLMGTRSGGGSGRGLSYTLPRSKVTVRLSSMASFQPDGRLYDGRGVEPDVEVKPRSTDLVGASDSVLDAALKRLLR
ncbi:MAG TPA: S41 family peptidase [Planctomycetota bacterium]|nr:S41 family peptidase [Planctomycetota bacterium]